MKKMMKKIGRWFYHRKIDKNICITRILFFRYRVDLSKVKGKNFSIDKLFPPVSIQKRGKHTYAATNLIYCSPDTSVGSFCSIGPDVTLGHGRHPINFLSSSPYFYFDALGFKSKDMPGHEEYWEVEPITIGNDVWIGDGAFIKNGLRIGDGAVIGARSVVTKDVPPYAIVAGVPARVLRYRFDEKTISELLQLKWWDLDDDVIRQIPYEDVERALAFLREVRAK